MPGEIETDYLIIGAGAMGMAFADTLVSESDCRVAIVDRYHQPGGHWNTAYPFVRLHQPSAFYGVNSRKLGSDTIDQVGWNQGFFELATGGEVCAYFDQVMNQQLLPSGRVSYFPMSEHLGDGRIRSFSGKEHVIKPTRRIVDATYMRVTVPSMRPPEFPVAADATCVPPNELARLRERFERYVIIGAGKTGMDACLWLLRHGVPADNLTWIMPRDSWLLNRAGVQPGQQFAKPILEGIAAQAQAIMDASSVDDLLDRLVACGRLLRFSDEVRPTMYRCAIASDAEFEQLRSIRAIVRKGRVRGIERDRIVLDEGTVPTGPGVLHIDCSADGLERRPQVPVFNGRQMTLQSVRSCQQVFSAAFIAHVEASTLDDDEKNKLCEPIPHPDATSDWLRSQIANGRNQIRWMDHPFLQDWLDSARLDGFSHLRPKLPTDAGERAVAIGKMKARLAGLNAKLESLLQANGEQP